MWMRHVDFENVKDMLHLVSQNNGLLKPRDFDNIGISKKVLITKSKNEPMSRSTRYNYRKVMEHLGLIGISDGKYQISNEIKIKKFLDITKFGHPMSEDGKEIIRAIIVSNDECRRNFFDIFMKVTTYDLADLRMNGMPMFIETPAMRTSCLNSNDQDESKSNIDAIKFRNSNGKVMVLKTADQIYAVYWGIRRWSAKLNITNEIMIDFAEGRMIYPINPNFDERIIYEVIIKFMCSDKSENEWVIIHIPYIIKLIIIETRFSLINIKNFLINLKNKFPSLIMFIPTSTIFIDIKTPYNRQDHLFRSSYLYDERKRYISHVRINKKLLEMLFNDPADS
jgi:hypothetical protein